MLRRKLVMIFGLLVLLLLFTAVGAIWMLQDILGELHHLDTQAWAVIENANRMGATVSMVEIELYDLEAGKQRHLDGLIERMELVEQQLKSLENSYVVQLPENAALIASLKGRLPAFRRHVASLATAQDPHWAVQHRRAALLAAVGLRQDTMNLSRNIGRHGEQEQRMLTSRFRWMVLALTVIFLVVINLSVVGLWRMTEMVLRPVEKLVEATRELGQERFDYRVELDQKDEFDELARAYNSLASQLQANEQRKLEMLGQVALTLNHELNNAIAIIQMQLELLSRQAGGNARIEQYARQIHESLARMTRTVESLKRVRRIVLTDYVSGVKMLDLERSVQDGASAATSGASASAIPQVTSQHMGQ